MDGFKKRLNESVQLKLSFLLSLTILVIAVIAGLFSFLSAFDEAHELQDDMLRQVAALFDQQHLPLAHLGDDGRAKGSNEESRVIVEYLADGNKIAGKGGSGAPLQLPSTLSDGLYTLEVQGEPFRVLIKTTSSSERIAVAQETGVRDEIARDSAMRTLMPLLILVPILLLIVANLVRQMFRPIALLSAEVDQRSDQELHPVEAIHLPAEVRPFVVAINQLLARVDQSMETQRRFVADAAHELRSPMTALALQAERLAHSKMPTEAQERLAKLRQGIERGRGLLEQLLALAKAQSSTAKPCAPISILQIYRHVLEDLMPLAEAKRLDIGITNSVDVKVCLDETDLMILLKNLVDNAIRYTPEGGRIDLVIATDVQHVILHIIDTGPGIPPEEHERVFDPFYRMIGREEIGSGLGLSIVKVIADRMGIKIQLGFSDEDTQSGLCVSVIIMNVGSNNESLGQDPCVK